MESEIVLSPAQTVFVESPKPYTLFCGGVGSGKTHAGAVWAMEMALTYPRSNGMITANSYSQLKKATLPKFFQILDENNVKYHYKSQEGEIEIGNTKIFTMSAEKYDIFRGVEIGWAWSDECAFYRKEAFDVLIGRIRDRKGPCLWKGTTTANGFNWLYDSFVSEPLSGSTIVTAKTQDNLANLSDNYYEQLKSQYDPRLARQELNGEFVNMSSGKVYYAFDRNAHVRKCDSTDNRYIWVGMDFNVNPLCGVFAYEEADRVFITAELYQKDSNTFKASKEIVERFPFNSISIVGDDSGSKRKTSGKTDYEILRRSGLHVINFRNPGVKDRYNNLNRLFSQGRLFIDPSCKKLIEDLEKMTYDNKDPMLSHASDALGYVCWHLNPLKKPKMPTKITYR